MEITFFGTNKFAATILKSLVNSEDFKIKAVVTRPDKPAGRKHELNKSPVKLLAEELKLNILQPELLDKNTAATIPKTPLFIIFGYGMIIPKVVLDIPKFGAINIHPSLLPKYRGATPVQSALINGETETGVSIMIMDEKMDHGPILAQKKVYIKPNETFLELDKRLMPIASHLLLEVVSKFVANKITAKAQNHKQATFCQSLTRSNGKIDFGKTATEIYNLYRGLTPWPGIWTTWNGKRLKLIKINKTNNAILAGLVKIEKNKMFIGFNKDSIEVLELQLEGKQSLLVQDFVKGYKINNHKLNT